MEATGKHKKPALIPVANRQLKVDYTSIKSGLFNYENFVSKSA